MKIDSNVSLLGMLVSWNVKCVEKQYYTLNAHYSYLRYLSTKYRSIILITSVVDCENAGTIDQQYCINNFHNINIVRLPPFKSSIKAVFNYFQFRKAILSVANQVDLFYCRVPDPFSWMPALIGRKPTIMHFVGDTIDATNHNEKWSWLKKKVMIAGYMPDYWMTLKAARKSRVYTNGTHLVERLAKYRVKAIPVVSSTVFEKDLHDDFKTLPQEEGKVVITYVGYVRFAKGMNCLMDFCKRLRDGGIDYCFNLIGNGEMFDDVKAFIEKEGLERHIIMHGHISDRDVMNKILRSSDLFFFPSLSEGSPRVVIEAMAQGTPVMSTPVGSLPGTFEDGETIRFFYFNDSSKAFGIVREYLANAAPFEQMRLRAYRKVAEQFTIEKFLSKVFNYET